MLVAVLVLVGGAGARDAWDTEGARQQWAELSGAEEGETSPARPAPPQYMLDLFDRYTKVRILNTVQECKVNITGGADFGDQS